MELLEKSSLSVQDVVDKAKDWALLHGLAMRPRREDSASYSTDHVEFVPFTLLPSRFPLEEYNAARSAQQLVNKLMHRVAHDFQFLAGALRDTIRVDDFTRRLFGLHEAAQKEQPVQIVSLGLLRADYMLDTRKSPRGDTQRVCKQVEVNTIASGQGWIGTACSRLHRYLLEEMDLTEYAKNMPENNPLEGLCRGMLEAWKIYNNLSAAVLFVVETSTQHIGDQRFHEYELRRLEPRIRVLRLTLAQLSTRAQLVGAERRLLVDGREIAVVYLRSGYSPEQYPGEAEWRARATIERSMAVKCPSLGYHLAGTKKVQQVLAGEAQLERFLNEEEARTVRRLFTGLYPLDFSPAGESALQLVLSHPEKFVLKPQREGGANNLFSCSIKRKLESIAASEDRLAWILMDRIQPVVQHNVMVHASNVSYEPREMTSELGIFGVVLGDSRRIFLNETLGHTLRSKLAHYDEGGVSSGFGACDSPLLV